MTHRESPYIDYVARRRQDGLARSMTDCTHPQPGIIETGGRRFINYSGNDYLGLAHHPAVIERAGEWAGLYGAGSGASRLVTGNIAPFRKVEEKISALKGTESALVFPSGFQANAGLLQALFSKQVLRTAPLVFSDRLNHASMHFGCAAAQVRQIRYRHLDMDHLSELLEAHRKDPAPRFILTESVFSMDGDIAPMDRICHLGEQYNCMIVCDDAHATGILGEKGAGLSDGAHIIVGTFSKAMGSVGAYIACSNAMREYLVNACTGLIYSTALSPMVLGAIDAALDLLPDLDAERRKVAALADEFRFMLHTGGFHTGSSASQIVPLIIGDTEKTLTVSETLREKGYWATAIRPPTVPKDSARLRFTFCPAHREEDLSKMVSVIQQAAD